MSRPGATWSGCTRSARTRTPSSAAWLPVPVNGRELHAGDAVCITGDTATPRDELEARAIAAGLRVTSAVSRKTRLVVAADPDTESTKARRARELGIPLIAEPVFLTMLRRGVISDPLVTNGQKPSGAPARPPLAAHS